MACYCIVRSADLMKTSAKRLKEKVLICRVHVHHMRTVQNWRRTSLKNVNFMGSGKWRKKHLQWVSRCFRRERRSLIRTDLAFLRRTSSYHIKQSKLEIRQIQPIHWKCSLQWDVSHSLHRGEFRCRKRPPCQRSYHRSYYLILHSITEHLSQL